MRAQLVDWKSGKAQTSQPFCDFLFHPFPLRCPDHWGRLIVIRLKMLPQQLQVALRWRPVELRPRVGVQDHRLLG